MDEEREPEEVEIDESGENPTERRTGESDAPVDAEWPTGAPHETRGEEESE